jgi:hypothetical protein
MSRIATDTRSMKSRLCRDCNAKKEIRSLSLSNAVSDIQRVIARLTRALDAITAGSITDPSDQILRWQSQGTRKSRFTAR